MFDISEKLIVGQSDEIYAVNTINWSDSALKHLSLIRDEEVVSLSHAKVYVFFRFSVMSWKNQSEPNIKYCLGATVGIFQRSITTQNFGHNRQGTDGIRVEYFPGFTTLQLINKVHEFMTKMGDPSQFTRRNIFMSMFNDIMW